MLDSEGYVKKNWRLPLLDDLSQALSKQRSWFCLPPVCPSFVVNKESIHVAHGTYPRCDNNQGRDPSATDTAEKCVWVLESGSNLKIGNQASSGLIIPVSHSRSANKYTESRQNKVQFVGKEETISPQNPLSSELHLSSHHFKNYHTDVNTDNLW